MVGQIYLQRNAKVTLSQTKTKYGVDVGFNMSFRPRARDIVPVSRKANGKDVELAQHLKHILQNNENGIMGEVQVTGEVTVFDHLLPRPIQNETFFQFLNFKTKVKGSFPWLLCKLCIDGTQVNLFAKVQLSNLFVGRENQHMATRLDDMEQTDNCKDIVWYEDGELFQHKYNRFCLNPSTWDNLLGKPQSKNKTGPKLTLVLCADLSARMARPLPIIGPNGKGYRLSLCQKKLANKRRLEERRGMETNAVIVAASGKEFPIYEQYFSEDSPVFQAMLQNPGFEEERTKRIHLPDVEDMVVECMTAYLHYFDISAWMKDLGLAVKMLEVAERFQIDGLKTGIRIMLRRRHCIEFTIGQALQLFVFTRHLDHFKSLNRKVFRILKWHEEKLQESQEFKELFEKEPVVAMELCKNAIQSARCFLQ